MSIIKAVVLEKSGSRFTVLGKNGTFRQVHSRSDAKVGEEIEIRTGLEDFSQLRVWAGAVAIFLLVMTTLLGWNLYQAPTAVALLSVDINPRLEFTVDAQGKLLKLQTQSDDAKRMLGQINLTGKPIDEVLDQIITQAIQQKYLNSDQNWVVVGYSPMTDKTSDRMPKQLNENQILEWVTQTVESKGLTPHVAVFSMTPQDKELAQKRDLTLGEYALWQTAQKAGVVTQVEQLKDTTEQARLLKNPQVQGQIMAEKKGIESVLPLKPKAPTKDLDSRDLSERLPRTMEPVEKLFSPSKSWKPSEEKKLEQAEEKPKQAGQLGDLHRGQPKVPQSNVHKDQQLVQEKVINKAPPEVSDHARISSYGATKDKDLTKEIVSAPVPWNSQPKSNQAHKIPERDWDSRQGR